MKGFQKIISGSEEVASKYFSKAASMLELIARTKLKRLWFRNDEVSIQAIILPNGFRRAFFVAEEVIKYRFYCVWHALSSDSWGRHPLVAPFFNYTKTGPQYELNHPSTVSYWSTPMGRYFFGKTLAQEEIKYVRLLSSKCLD